MTDHLVRVSDIRGDILPETGDPSADIVVLNTSEVLALLDLAEAAHRLSFYIPDDIYYPRDHDRALLAFNAYLARFDFGDRATEGANR